MNVAVVGASDDPQKYSYLATVGLRDKGHKVFPVHPKIKEIEGMKVYRSLHQIQEPIDTVTLYVSEEVSQKMREDIIGKLPRRIIFNPGAENPQLEELAEAKGITTLNACTLVMLKTGQL